MASETLHIFDPRRNLQLQGFTGRGATTTNHDATETLHLTRFTVTSTDCRVETQLTATVNAGDASLPVQSTAGFSAADGIWIERAGTNEEQTTVAGVLSNSLAATVSMGHPNGSFVTRKTKAWHVAQRLADIINTAGASVAGRFGPDQSGVIHADAWASGPSTGGITITFVLASGTTSRYGKLGNLDRVFIAHGRTLGGVPVGSGQGFQWSAGSGTSILFANGDNNTKYHVTLDFIFCAVEPKAGRHFTFPTPDC